jgi:aromatic ring-cleaving dioxygenase
MNNTEAFLKQWHMLKREELTAQIAPSTTDDKERTIDCIFYSGADVDRFS